MSAKPRPRTDAELDRADSIALFLGLGAIVACALLGLFAGGAQ